MKQIEKVPAILLLADGTVFNGFAAGKIGTTAGEICFNTGMTGYQEIFTDPSYYGQLMVTTNAHIGNYGTRKVESESKNVQIAGLICRNFTNPYSRFMADSSIQDFLLEHQLIAISDIDTRALVLHIRENGAMNGIISSEILDTSILAQKLLEVPQMEGLELASKVSVAQAYEVGDVAANYRVAVMDYGAKENILNSLQQRDAYLKVFPHNATYEEVMEWQPQGIMLSNGPGDPATLLNEVAVVKQFIESETPVFGICLGHQLIAEAAGLTTFKMHHGHRGINHPVKNLATGRCEITSQNHGFSVNPDSLKNNPEVEITHLNLNDHSIEGIKLKNKKVFSVQYHPEACPGPHDSRYLFDQFISTLN